MHKVKFSGILKVTTWKFSQKLEIFQKMIAKLQFSNARNKQHSRIFVREVLDKSFWKFYSIKSRSKFSSESVLFPYLLQLYSFFPFSSFPEIKTIFFFVSSNESWKLTKFILETLQNISHYHDHHHKKYSVSKETLPKLSVID